SPQASEGRPRPLQFTEFRYGRDEAYGVVELLGRLAGRHGYHDRSEEARLVADRRHRAAGFLSDTRLPSVVAGANGLVEARVVGGLDEVRRQIRGCDGRDEQIIVQLGAALMQPGAEFGVQPVEPVGSVPSESGAQHPYRTDRKCDPIAERLGEFASL